MKQLQTQAYFYYFWGTFVQISQREKKIILKRFINGHI